MSSSLFSIARTALISHQRVLETVSHNIANAETPGYSRQDAQLGASPPVRLASGMIGTGVQVQSVTRKRDTLLDDTFRAANGSNGESAMLRDTLTGVESIFGEPSDSGMSNALDRFFNAWSDLATTPTSQANRFLVQQAGAQVASLLNSYNDGLNSQRTSAVDRLSTTVVSINQLAQQVAGLNTRISASEVGGELANDLRDQRDVLLDKLSGMAGTRVISQADGSLSVLIGNSTLIDGTTARPLTLAVLVPNPPVVPPSSDLGVQVRLGDGVDALRPLGGEVKTLVDAVNTTLPGLRARLDKLASSLATQVNTLHQRGYTFVNNVGAGTAAGGARHPRPDCCGRRRGRAARQHAGDSVCATPLEGIHGHVRERQYHGNQQLSRFLPFDGYEPWHRRQPSDRRSDGRGHAGEPGRHASAIRERREY
jgi:flagellar hook-associated protein 1 FlgK